MLDWIAKSRLKQGKSSLKIARFGNLAKHEEKDLTNILFLEAMPYGNQGAARALGVTANYVWAHALGQPLERPKSLTTKMLEDVAAKASQPA